MTQPVAQTTDQSTGAATAATSDSARNALLALRAEIAKAVVGQDAVVSGLVIALLCRGHVLLEGVPGVAKTLLVRTLAAALQLEFKRVQFTPDLMPGDITGSLVYDARTAEFEFHPGPVFTNLLLADEINRTPPKTQAALLEAMEERQVSVEGEPRPLPDPFIVAATQNPIEYEGTYQLPEAQLDRFLLKLNVPLPPRDQEIAILDRHARGFDPRDLSAVQPVAGAGELAAGRAAVGQVLVADEVLGYIVDIVGATRHSPSLQLGVSPRGATALLATARSWAWLSGRNYVTPDDVKAMARPTLRHRVALRPEAELEGRQSRRCAGRDPGFGSGAPLVVLTGRTGLVALICVLPIALSPWPATAFTVLLALLATAVVVDVSLAASTRRLQFTRSGDTAARLGQPVDAELTIENAGRRRFRGQVRDAWPPSAQAEPRTHTLNIRRRTTDQREYRPATGAPRRPVVGVGHGALDRTARYGGSAELAPCALADPDPAAVPVPQTSAVAAGQVA